MGRQVAPEWLDGEEAALDGEGDGARGEGAAAGVGTSDGCGVQRRRAGGGGHGGTGTRGGRIQIGNGEEDEGLVVLGILTLFS